MTPGTSKALTPASQYRRGISFQNIHSNVSAFVVTVFLAMVGGFVLAPEGQGTLASWMFAVLSTIGLQVLSAGLDYYIVYNTGYDLIPEVHTIHVGRDSESSVFRAYPGLR